MTVNRPTDRAGSASTGASKENGVLQIRRLLLLAATTILGGCVIPGQSIPGADTAEARTAAHFDRIRDEPVMLNMFLRGMPKGADLHNHLSGAVYAESFLDWAARD